MLYTNLKHIETAAELERAINDYENVVIICGRMDPASIESYCIAEELEKKYSNIKFYDMEFDNPETMEMQNTMEICKIGNLPLIGYFINNNLIYLSYGVQSKELFEERLKKEFKLSENV